MTSKMQTERLIAREREMHYWWFKYLQASPGYRQCCDSGGSGPWSWLYEYLGDVRTVSYQEWWANHQDLFFVPMFTMEEVTTEDAAADFLHSQQDGWLLVAVHLHASTDELRAAFQNMIAKHKKRGFRASGPVEVDFPLSSPESLTLCIKLKRCLAVWEMVTNARTKPRGTPGTRMWEIYHRVRDEKPPQEESLDRADRNMYDASVGRDYRYAQDVLNGLLLGVFPAGRDPKPNSLCPRSAKLAYRRLKEIRAAHPQHPSTTTLARP